MRESQVIRSKKVNLSLGSKFSCNTIFSLSIFCWNYNNWYWYAFANV